MSRCWGHYPHIALALSRALADGPLRIHALTDALRRPGHTRKEDKFAVNGAVIRLEACGLIAYRAPCWGLTDKGRVVLAAATDAGDAMRDALAAALWARLPADRAASLTDVAKAVPAALETIGYAGLAAYVVAAETALALAGDLSTLAAGVETPPAGLTEAVAGLDAATAGDLATAREGLNTINAGLLP